MITIRDKEHLQETIRQIIEAEGPNADLNHLDVSKLNDMSGLFGMLYENGEVKYTGFPDFNGDISDWNVSKVQNMAMMFCMFEMFNGDLSDWDVSNVQTMARNVYRCAVYR